MPERTDIEGASDGREAAAISSAIVALFREHYGRGPIKAKTFMLDDYVLTVLHETLTKAEQTLVDAGHEENVREFRLAFQKELAAEFEAVVSGATGRSVVSYLSQIAFHPEVCFEFFWLAPAGDGG